jgi:hypothetical protein
MKEDTAWSSGLVSAAVDIVVALLLSLVTRKLLHTIVRVIN